MTYYQEISKTNKKIQNIIEDECLHKKQKLKELWILVKPIVLLNISKSSLGVKSFLIDDLLQDAYIVLQYCFEHYNRKKFSNLFLTYYLRSVRYEIRKAFNRYTAGGVSTSEYSITKYNLNKIIEYINDYNFKEIEDKNLIVLLNEDKINSKFFEEYMQKSFSSNLDCYIFELIYFNNLSDSEISSGLIISSSDVKSARRRLRKFILRNKDILKQFL